MVSLLLPLSFLTFIVIMLRGCTKVYNGLTVVGIVLRKAGWSPVYKKAGKVHS